MGAYNQSLNDIVSPQKRSEAVKAFMERIQTAAEKLTILDNAVVCTHHDCDGLTSGSIMTQALRRAGVEVSPITLKQLYSEDVDRLKKMNATVVFTDFGSSYIELLKKEMRHPFFVIDHHQRGNGEWEGHINPMEFGLDGGIEVSAAGTAYLVAREMDKKNNDLAAVAVVGAVGDMQDSRGNGLMGLNAEIVREGMDADVLNVKTDLRLYGRISRPLIQYLSFSTNSILPELTANPENCARFLDRLGISLQETNGKWRSYEDLLPEEKKTLSTGLLMHLHEHNTPEWKMNEMIGEVYTLTHENPQSPLRDAKEYSTVMNATGRNGASHIGFQVCMGDREEYYAQALALLHEHRQNLAQGIQLMQTEGLVEHPHFYFFDAENRIKDSIVGIVAGMLYGSGSVKTDKPIVAFSRHEDGSIKVSARATTELVRNGINLGGALKETCHVLGEGNEGGGHRIAAGAKILNDKRNAFLEVFDTKIGEQIHNKKTLLAES